MIDIMKIVEDSGVLFDEFTERVKNEMKQQEGGFLEIC